MEFKNFENKLIIEKITNYCIENNISTQKINALTAKIKFGNLNENAFTDWAGEKIGTSGGNYRKSIRVVQDNLQKAMDYLKAVDADMNPADNNNIFRKNKVTLEPAKEAELQNAVSKLKGAIAQYGPMVTASLQKIGGQISGSSNYGDEQSFDFDAMFPELENNGTLAKAFEKAYTVSVPTAAGGAPTTKFPDDKKADLNRILLQSRQNILKTFKKLDASKHGEFIQKIKTTVTEAITKFGTPTTVADGYALLNTIVGGTSTPTSNPNPTKLPLTERTFRSILANPKLNQVYYDELLKSPHKDEITKLFDKVYDGNSLNVDKMRRLFEKAFLAVPASLANPPAGTAAATTADANVTQKIIDQIESLFY